MEFLKFIFFHFLIFTLSACSFSTAKNSIASPKPNTVLEKVSLGTIKKLDGQQIDLDQLSDKPIVLIFASDVCVTCAEEADYWRDVFSKGLPKNIEFFHIMIGGILEDSIDWAEFHRINWPIAIAPGDELFKTYCSEIRTPCTLIYSSDKGEIFQTYQVLKQEELERITGKWVF